MLDKGPSPGSPDAAAFRAFWGDKAELRRFQVSLVTCKMCGWEGDCVSAVALALARRVYAPRPQTWGSFVRPGPVMRCHQRACMQACSCRSSPKPPPTQRFITIILTSSTSVAVPPPCKSTPASASASQISASSCSTHMQDGSISEAVAWECPPHERHLILDRILQHVLARHMGGTLVLHSHADLLSPALHPVSCPPAVQHVAFRCNSTAGLHSQLYLDLCLPPSRVTSPWLADCTCCNHPLTSPLWWPSLPVLVLHVLLKAETPILDALYTLPVPSPCHASPEPFPTRVRVSRPLSHAALQDGASSLPAAGQAAAIPVPGSGRGCGTALRGSVPAYCPVFPRPAPPGHGGQAGA